MMKTNHFAVIGTIFRGSRRINTTRILAATGLLPLLASTQIVRAASHTWSGAVNGLWSQTGNWSAGGAPVAGETPLFLTFPAGASHFSTTNDVAALQVDTLTLSGSGYTLYATAGKILTLKGTATNIFCSGINTLDTSVGLILSNTNFISVATNNELNIKGPISGAGSLGKVGPGQLDFYGSPANTYSGATLVYDGTLALQRGASVNSPAIAVPGTLIIGIPGGTNLQATVMDSYPEQIADTGPITINYACELALNGYAETIGPLTLNYGSIDGNFAGSLLKLNGDVTSTGDSPGTSVGCAISLGGATRTFTVGNGNYYLELNGTISDGGASAGLIKAGPGMLNSQVSNSYSGLTLIKDGLLIAADAHALGSTAAGTVVTNTGMLRLGGNFAVGAEPLTLSGFGFGYCSVYSDANSVSWAGPVTLASNTAVGVQNGTVTFSGGISGPGGFAKIYPGTVAFAGTNANTYAGTTTVTGGTLQLNKLGAVSVPGTLIIGDDLGGTNLVVVQCTQTNAIANAAAVTVNGSGTLNMAWLFGASDTIGSLSGSGAVSLGLNTLTTGGNNSNTNFSGTFSGFASAAIVKEGFGTWTLSGASSSYLGNTYVNAGKLVVNGSLGGSLQMNYLSSLGGTGAVGSVTGTLGHVGPGNSIGKISTGNFTLNNGSSSLDIQINGATPGSGYDQLNVAGTVTLSNPKLNVTPMFSGALGNQYVIIANDGADAITGTFLNLPEGTNFTSGGMQFMITYKGGDGNDVVLTQLSLPAPSHIGTVSKLGNGQMQISGTGLAGLTYDLQATTNLSTPNWTKIGTVQADTNGIINLTDPNVAQFPARFYRFKGN